MLSMELNDIISMVRCLQSCHCCIDIHSLISFSSSDTRSASSHKMIHSISSTNHFCHFFFNRIPRLWNALPPIDLDLSINTIKKQLNSFGSILPTSLTPSTPAHSILFAHAANVLFVPFTHNSLNHFNQLYYLGY